MSIKYWIIALILILIGGSVIIAQDVDKVDITDECLYNISVVTKYKEPKYKTKEICTEILQYIKCDKPTELNGTCEDIQNVCSTVTYLTKLENKTKTKIKCGKYKQKIKYKDIEYTLPGYCTDHDTYILCDDEEDGNGDGICNPGETCYNYSVGNKMKLMSIWNGNKRIK